jgi:hypothetical protein
VPSKYASTENEEPEAVLTEYPQAQNLCPLKFFFRRLYFSNNLIALLPLMYPTLVDTEYFAGIARHMWTWSAHNVPSTTSTPLYSHKRRRIVPNFLRSFPYTILRRFFGIQTIWYLHS